MSDPDVQKEYKYLIIACDVFGAKILLKMNNAFCSQRYLKILLTIINAFWNVLSIYYLTVTLYASFISDNTSGYIHAVDIILIILLRFVFNSKIGELLKSIDKVIQFRKQFGLQVKYQTFKTYLFFFFIVTFINFSLWIASMLLKKNFSQNIGRYTFGIHSMMENQNRLLIFTYCIVSIKNFLFTGFTATTVLIAYCSLLEQYKALNTLNLTSADILQSNITIGKLIRINDSLFKFYSLVRKVNDILSPILFIWFAYWIINSCYSFSTLFGSHHKFGVTLSAYLLYTATLFSQFLLLVFLADYVDNEILKTKDIIVSLVERDHSIFCDVSKAMNFGLIISSAERYRQQISITPLGMFRLEKRLILAILGIIVTYEVIILQLIAK